MNPSDDNEGENGSESNDHNKEQACEDPLAGCYSFRRPRRGHGLLGPQGHMGPLAPVYMNFQVKCPICFCKGL